VLSAGSDDGPGRWLLSPRQLAALTVAPPAGWAGDLSVQVTAVAVRNRGGELTSASERVVWPLSGHAEAALPLALAPSLLAAGPSPDVLMIRGVPAGARLSAGTYDPATDGWVLRPDQLTGLTVTVPVGQPGVALTVLGVALAADGRAAARVLARPTLPPT
jgi:hypothetical protein